MIGIHFVLLTQEPFAKGSQFNEIMLIELAKIDKEKVWVDHSG
jgi:hypothetical protein